MRGKILVLGLICLFFIFGCKKQLPTSSDIPDTKSLRINYFTATPEGILPKGVSVLSWSVSNALYITLEGGYWESPIEVEAVGTKEVAPSRDTTYILTVSNETNSIFKTVTVKILACVEVMRDSVSCQRGLYLDGEEVLLVKGRVENVGNETAYSVMVKVILFDPDGNFLAEKHSSLYYMYIPYPLLGTVADLPQNEYFTFRCLWLIKENLEMIEQFNLIHNPYRPDRDPARCVVITWDN